MPPTIEVHMIIEAESAEHFLERAELALGNEKMIEFLEGPANEWFVKRATDRFENEGDDASGRWPGLSDATIAIRQALGYGAGPINVRTGELRSWATSKGEITEHDDAIAGIWPGEDFGAGPGNELATKIVHAQQGGRDPRSGNAFPARPVVAFSDRDVVGISLGFAKWFQEATTL